MPVVNSEFAKNITLNGRVAVEKEEPAFDANNAPIFDGNKKTVMTRSRIVKVTLVPGLNTVTNDQMAMLMANDTFEYHCSTGDMSTIQHTTAPKQDNKNAEEVEEDDPENIADIRITAMNVAEAGKVIGSTATLELLDKFESEEKGAEKPRKGILGAIKSQRQEVQSIIKKQEDSR